MASLTREQLIQNIDALERQGAPKEDIQSYINTVTIINQGAQSSQDSLPNTILPDNLVRGLAKPFLKTAATLAGGAGVAIAGVLGGKEYATKAQDIATQEGIDFGGYFGKVKPIGAEPFSKLQAGEQGVVATGAGMLADLAGTGLEVASYAYAPLKVGSGAGILSNVFNPVQWLKNAKAVAPFAAPFATGIGLQSFAEGDGSTTEKVGQATIEAAGAYAGAAYGFGVLNGGGVTLGKWGAKLMQKPAVKAFAEKLGDSISNAQSWVQNSSKQRLGQTFDYGTINFKNQIDSEIIALSDSVMDSFQTKVPNKIEILDSLQTNMYKYIGQQYRVKNELYGKFIDDAGVTVSKFDSTANTIAQAKQFVDDSIKTAVKNNRPIDESFNDLDAFISQLNINKSMNLREAYTNSILGDGRVTSNGAVNEWIRKISYALEDDMTNAIATQKPELNKVWMEARNQSRNVRQNIDNEFASKITSAATLDNMVDDLLKGGDPLQNREQMRSLLRAFPEQKDRDVLSQVFFNSILDKAKLSDTPAVRAKTIDDAITYLQGFGSDSIINPGHLEQLQQVSRIANTNFTQAIVNAQRIGKGGGAEFIPRLEKAVDDMVKYNFIAKIASNTNNFRNYSILGDEIASIKSVEELNAVLSLLDGDQELMNVVGQEIIRGITTRHSQSTISGTGQLSEEALRKQMSGILKDLNRIGGTNKDEIYKQLFGQSKVKIQGIEEPMPLDQFITEMQKSVDTLGAIENLSGENLLKAAHLVTGLAYGFTYGFTGRTVPATYHLSQLSKVSKTSKMPMEQWSKLVDDLQMEGYLRIDGKKVKAGNYMRKLGEKMQTAAQATPIPTAIGGLTLDEIMGAVAEMTGRAVLPEELEPLLFGE